MNEKCSICGSEFKTVPAGVSKFGKPYDAFIACSKYGCKGKPAGAPIYKRESKVEQVKQMQENKAVIVGRAMERKEDSIKMAGAARDATLIVTTFYPEFSSSYPDKETNIKNKWLYWKEYFYNRSFEAPRPDTEAF